MDSLRPPQLSAFLDIDGPDWDGRLYRKFTLAHEQNNWILTTRRLALLGKKDLSLAKTSPVFSRGSLLLFVPNNAQISQHFWSPFHGDDSVSLEQKISFREVQAALQSLGVEQVDFHLSPQMPQSPLEQVQELPIHYIDKLSLVKQGSIWEVQKNLSEPGLYYIQSMGGNRSHVLWENRGKDLRLFWKQGASYFLEQHLFPFGPSGSCVKTVRTLSPHLFAHALHTRLGKIPFASSYAKWTVDHAYTDEEKREHLLPVGDVNAPIRFGGSTLLIEACKRGHLELVDLILAKGGDVNIPDRYNRTPLHIALRQNHRELVDRVLAESPVLKGLAVPILNTACRYASYACSARLVKLGAPVDVSDPRDRNMAPLHYAAIQNDSKLLSLLIGHGASLDTGCTAVFGLGKLTAIDLTRLCGAEKSEYFLSWLCRKGFADNPGL